MSSKMIRSLLIVFFISSGVTAFTKDFSDAYEKKGNRETFGDINEWDDSWESSEDNSE